jgi:hypothetical protein
MTLDTSLTPSIIVVQLAVTVILSDAKNLVKMAPLDSIRRLTPPDSSLRSE